MTLTYIRKSESGWKVSDSRDGPERDATAEESARIERMFAPMTVESMFDFVAPRPGKRLPPPA